MKKRDFRFFGPNEFLTFSPLFFFLTHTHTHAHTHTHTFSSFSIARSPLALAPTCAAAVSPLALTLSCSPLPPLLATGQGQRKAAFTYDRVFDFNSTQEAVYDYAAKPIVEGARGPKRREGAHASAVQPLGPVRPCPAACPA